jgi:hypothetical protein
VATVEHSIEIAVPSEVAARDLPSFAYRSAIGHYRVADSAMQWNDADECETEGTVVFEPLDTERTRMTLRVGYRPDATPNCEPAVTSRVAGEVREFKHYTEQRYGAAVYQADASSAT